MFERTKKLENGAMMHEIWDIPYSEEYGFDFYGPTKEAGTFPCIIYFHGGGLREGKKGDISDFCHDFIKNGYGFFSVDYPLYPNTRFPLYLQEAAKAVSFIFDCADKYGCNGDIYLMGQSAGAYIVLMLMANKEYFSGVNFDWHRIKGFITESGTCTDHIAILEFEMGLDPYMTRITDRSPIYYIDKNFESSPLLLTYNKDDPFLNRDNGNRILYNQLKYFTNVDVTIRELPGVHCEGSRKNPDGTYNFNEAVYEWFRRKKNV